MIARLRANRLVLPIVIAALIAALLILYYAELRPQAAGQVGNSSATHITVTPQQESAASSSNDSTAPAPNADQGQVLAAETQNAVTPPPSKPVTASAATVQSAHTDNNSDINTSTDPDDSKPVSVVTPPTEPISPPHPICHYPMLEPADVLPWCGNPPPPYPCHPMQPGTMIACPITYKAQ